MLDQKTLMKLGKNTGQEQGFLSMYQFIELTKEKSGRLICEISVIFKG